MNSAAASAAVYSLLAILLIAGVVALLPELFRSWARLRALESAADSQDALTAIAISLLLDSPELCLRWAGRGFPPPASLFDEREIRSALARL